MVTLLLVLAVKGGKLRVLVADCFYVSC